MAGQRDIRGREFSKNIRAMRTTQAKANRARRGRTGQSLRAGFTTDGSFSRSKMRSIDELDNISVSRDHMLYTLWEIVRLM